MCRWPASIRSLWQRSLVHAAFFLRDVVVGSDNRRNITRSPHVASTLLLLLRLLSAPRRHHILPTSLNYNKVKSTTVLRDYQLQGPATRISRISLPVPKVGESSELLSQLCWDLLHTCRVLHDLRLFVFQIYDHWDMENELCLWTVDASQETYCHW